VRVDLRMQTGLRTTRLARADCVCARAQGGVIRATRFIGMGRATWCSFATRNFHAECAEVFPRAERAAGCEEGATTEIIAGLMPGECREQKTAWLLEAQLWKSNLGAGVPVVRGNNYLHWMPQAPAPEFTDEFTSTRHVELDY